MATRKNQIVSDIMEKVNVEGEPRITKATIERTYNAMLGVIAEELKQSGICKLSGIGTFKTRVTPEKDVVSRLGDEPKTYHVPEKTVVSFKASAVLKDFMNNAEETFC